MAPQKKEYKPLSRKNDLELLRASLEVERSSFLTHWKTLGDYILPRRPRFDITDVNRGDRRNLNIIDSTATLAARTLRSGMMAGVTSPARPWFRLTTSDSDLAEYGPVKEWLHLVSRRMSAAFLKSNLYNTLPTLYGDMGVFATGAMFVEEDFNDVIRTYSVPIGSYYISNNDKGRVCTFVREFRMTVRQVVQRFAKRNEKTGDIVWDNISTQVRNLWDNHNLEVWVDIVHVIRPNPDFDPTKSEARFKKYYSCYYERGATGVNKQSYPFGDGTNDQKFLKELGYDFFPVLAPKWEVTGEDTYGTECPGMAALGDIKSLQIMHKRKAQAIEKMVNPPLVGPSALRNHKVSLLPGDITYSDERTDSKGLRSIHETSLRLGELINDIREHQSRIQRAFYEDLFLMLSTSDRRTITAREVEERHEEKLLALGPVLEQLNQDALDPLIDITFNIMSRQGLIPVPPEELQGMDLKVEYVSVMAQAQKLIGISGLERMAGFVMNLSGAVPSVLDKMDFDQTVDEYGEATGVPPQIIRSDDDVEAIREAQREAQRAQQLQQGIQGVSGIAKDLSQMDMSKDTALKRLVDQAEAGQLVETP